MMRDAKGNFRAVCHFSGNTGRVFSYILTAGGCYTTISSVTEKLNVLIIYSSRNPLLSGAAGIIAGHLVSAGFVCEMTPVESLDFTRILPASLIVAGADETQDQCSSGSYHDVSRVLQGMNLSDRMLGIIYGSQSTVPATMERMFRDTEINLMPEPLRVGSEDNDTLVPETDIDLWSKKLINAFKEFAHERHLSD